MYAPSESQTAAAGTGPSAPGLARLLAVLSAIVTMLLWGPLLLGIAFGVADSPGEDHTGWLVLFWFVLVGWPVASVTVVAAAWLVGRWPRLAAGLLLLAGAAMMVPLVLGGLLALAAAGLAYLSSGATEAAPRKPVRAPALLRAAAIGAVVVVGIVALAMMAPTAMDWLDGGDGGDEPTVEEEAAGPFTSPEDTVRDYAERLEPPLLGDCGSLAEAGACVAASSVSDDQATYTLCFRQKGTCVILELLRKDDAWAVASEREANPEEGPP